MTDKQIKQNADAYANNYAVKSLYRPAYDGFVAGAHSRDEEIKDLEARIYMLEKAIKVNKYFEEAKLDQLRNPWISVEEGLPKNGDIVFTHSIIKVEGGGERHEEEQFIVQKFVGHWITDRMEQHRMGCIMYDTIDKVTHWMPIPQIEKGE